MRCTLQVSYVSDDDQASYSHTAEGCGLRQVRHSRVQAYPCLVAARSDNQKGRALVAMCKHGVCAAKSHEVHRLQC